MGVACSKTTFYGALRAPEVSVHSWAAGLSDAAPSPDCHIIGRCGLQRERGAFNRGAGLPIS